MKILKSRSFPAGVVNQLIWFQLCSGYGKWFSNCHHFVIRGFQPLNRYHFPIQISLSLAIWCVTIGERNHIEWSFYWDGVISHIRELTPNWIVYIVPCTALIWGFHDWNYYMTYLLPKWHNIKTCHSIQFSHFENKNLALTYLTNLAWPYKVNHFFYRIYSLRLPILKG